MTSARINPFSKSVWITPAACASIRHNFMYWKSCGHIGCSIALLVLLSGGILCSAMLAANVFGLCVRACFGAKDCQPALNLNISTNFQVCTSPRLTHNPFIEKIYSLRGLEALQNLWVSLAFSGIVLPPNQYCSIWATFAASFSESSFLFSGNYQFWKTYLIFPLSILFQLP
jgi:hypothetical protein